LVESKLKWVCITLQNEPKKGGEVRNDRRMEWRTYEGMRLLDLMDLEDESGE